MAQRLLNKWTLPVATAAGALGGFPAPPPMIAKLLENEMVQYLQLFVLIWQGGGGQNWQTSLI